MKKGFTLFFDDSNGSVRRLKSFKHTYDFVIKNFEDIRKAYNKVNEAKKLFAKVPQLTTSAEKFEAIRKDLKLASDTKQITFKAEHARFFTLEIEDSSEQVYRCFNCKAENMLRDMQQIIKDEEDITICPACSEQMFNDTKNTISCEKLPLVKDTAEKKEKLRTKRGAMPSIVAASLIAGSIFKE